MKDEKVECKRCGKILHKYGLKEHMKNHFNLDTGSLKCDICLKEFGRVSLLKIHKLTHIKRDKSFKCDQCDKA